MYTLRTWSRKLTRPFVRREYPRLSPPVDSPQKPISFVVVRFSNEYLHNILKSECLTNPINELVTVDNASNLYYDNLVEAMQAKNLPVTYINYPDEGHGFQKPENRLSFFAAMEGFLGKCLGVRVQPIGDSFEGSSGEVLAGAEYIDGLENVSSGG